MGCSFLLQATRDLDGGGWRNDVKNRVRRWVEHSWGTELRSMLLAQHRSKGMDPDPEYDSRTTSYVRPKYGPLSRRFTVAHVAQTPLPEGVALGRNRAVSFPPKDPMLLLRLQALRAFAPFLEPNVLGKLMRPYGCCYKLGVLFGGGLTKRVLPLESTSRDVWKLPYEPWCMLLAITILCTHITLQKNTEWLVHTS